jgi:isopentenyl phosphate kinase
VTDRLAAPGPVVVKLGGSLITRKREVEKARPKVLTRLATEVAEARRPVVILHGAGSFGHPGARRFGLAGPPESPKALAARTRGASIVAGEVRRLHLLVLRALVDAGVTAWSVPANVLAENRAGILTRLETGPFASALEQGRVPVSFGDVVPDAMWGSSILSADSIAVELARALHASRVVFASDVPGVYTGPVRKGKKVVAELSAETVGGLMPSKRTADVTRGIRGKAEAMLAIADAGVDAVLISGLSDGALSRAIRGEAVYGSWAHARA